MKIPPKPKTDAEFFETVAKIIFISGFRWSVVNDRWPKMKKAFHNFDIDKISREKMENLLGKDGMIKNKPKINAIIENAKMFSSIRKEHGTVLNWVKKIQKDNLRNPLFNPSVRDEMKKFIKIGDTTSRWLAYIVTRDKKLLER